MLLKELKQKMLQIKKIDDEEIRHKELDKLLLKYINDEKITTIFNSIKKWYA